MTPSIGFSVTGLSASVKQSLPTSRQMMVDTGVDLS